MKKLICLLLALSMTTLLFACDRLPEGVENDARPVSTEPSTEAPTEEPTAPPTEPTEEENPLLKEISEKYKTVNSYVNANLRCEEDSNGYGRVTYTSLTTGEVVKNINGYYFELPFTDEDYLDWRKAVPTADGLFADATYVVRLESLANETWYMEFHNGSDAKYIYFSQLDLYVPFFGRHDPAEKVNGCFKSLKDSYLWFGTDFRIEGSSPKEVAELYCARLLELYTATEELAELGEIVVGYKDVSITNISYELSDDGKELTISYEITATAMGDYPLFAGHVWQNEDGSWTCASMMSTLCLDEDGKWFNPNNPDFYRP